MYTNMMMSLIWTSRIQRYYSQRFRIICLILSCSYLCLRFGCNPNNFMIIFFNYFFIVYDIGIHFFNIFIFGFTLSHIDYSLMIFKVCYWGLFYLHGNEKILCQINLDMLRIYLNVFLLESKRISHIKNFKIIFKNIR